MWDYIKNASQYRDEAENRALEVVWSLPGKRENQRYESLHIMTHHDIESGGDFADVVRYGGGAIDDHQPTSMLCPGKPTIFHPAPSLYRCFISANVENLLFPGRNIPVIQAVLSCTLVMATRAVLG